MEWANSITYLKATTIFVFPNYHENPGLRRTRPDIEQDAVTLRHVRQPIDSKRRRRSNHNSSNAMAKTNRVFACEQHFGCTCSCPQAYQRRGTVAKVPGIPKAASNRDGHIKGITKRHNLQLGHGVIVSVSHDSSFLLTR